MREQQAQFRTVDRAAGPGDLLVVDYTLALAGEEPSRQSGYEFLVGSGTVLPEIDQAVVDMRAGAERQVPFRLDDDFAKSLGEFESIAALRAEVLKQLEARRAHDETRALQEKVVDAVLNT